MGEGSGPALSRDPATAGTQQQKGTNGHSSLHGCGNNRVIDVNGNLPFPKHLTDCVAHEKRPKCLHSVRARAHFPPYKLS